MLQKFGRCVLVLVLTCTLLFIFAHSALGNKLVNGGDEGDYLIYLPLILRNYVAGPVQLEKVTVDGPISGAAGDDIHLHATLRPANAAEPISYTWSTDGLVSGQGTSTTVYSWNTVGAYTGILSVTQFNGARVFTAAYGAFITGPPVGAIDPPDRSKKVTLGTKITITFTEEMTTGAETYTALEATDAFRVLEQGFYHPVSGSLTLGGAKLQFTPTTLSPEASYVVVVNEGIRDLAGASNPQIAAAGTFTCCEEILPDQTAYYFSTITSDTVRAHHPINGQRNILLNDVAYDVDSSSRISITALSEMITTAHQKATAAYTATDVITAWSEAPSAQYITDFHFWPNIINLTEVYTQDIDLYGVIVDNLLANETITRAQALRTALDSEISNGDRVFLARDFVTQVTYDFQTHFEVGYALLINLDKRDTTEVLIHGYGGLGLPVLHDPHTEELTTIFGNVAAAPLGKVWDLCLRGNFRKHKYDAIVVDKLEETGRIFFIERVAMGCNCMNHLRDATYNPNLLPDQPWNPWLPGHPITEPLPIPEKPNFGGQTTAPPPVFTPASAVNPWPYLLPELEPHTEPQEAGSEGAPEGACDPTELAEIAAKIEQLQAELEQMRQEREADRENFDGNPDNYTYGSRYEWKPDASFNDDCLRTLFETYNSQISVLQAELDNLEAQISDLYGQLEDAEEALDPVLQALLHRDSLWENMLWVIGEWHDVPPEPCMPPWIPGGGQPFEDGSGNSVIIIGAEEQRQFQIALARALSGSYEFDEDGNAHYVPGLPFEQALRVALSDPNIHKFTNAHGQEVSVRPGDPVMEMIWRTYAECLKRLYDKIMNKFLKAVYGDDLSDTQLEQMKQVMLNGESALSAGQKQQLEDYKTQNKDLRDQIAQLRAQANEKQKEIDRLRNEFRQLARECFATSLENIYRQRLRIRILQAFLIWCEDPEATEAYPWYFEGHLDRFCEVLREMQDSPDYGPSLKGYVQMLITHNCPNR